MVQNHVLQLLCLIAMEPPTVLDERFRCVTRNSRCCKRFAPVTGMAARQTLTVRGAISAPARSRARRSGLSEGCRRQTRAGTETFTALKVEIGNWRWSGVSVLICARESACPEQCSEIVVTFKQVRHSIFPGGQPAPLVPNKLGDSLAAGRGVTQITTMKAPGSGHIALIPASLQLISRNSAIGACTEAYERCLPT